MTGFAITVEPLHSGYLDTEKSVSCRKLAVSGGSTVSKEKKEIPHVPDLTPLKFISQ